VWAVITQVVITEAKGHVGPERIHQPGVALIGEGPGLLGAGKATCAKSDIVGIENIENGARAAADEREEARGVRELQDDVSEDRELIEFGIGGGSAADGTDAVVMKAAFGFQGQERREFCTQSHRAAEASIELHLVAGN